MLVFVRKAIHQGIMRLPKMTGNPDEMQEQLQAQGEGGRASPATPQEGGDGATKAVTPKAFVSMRTDFVLRATPSPSPKAQEKQPGRGAAMEGGKETQLGGPRVQLSQEVRGLRELEPEDVQAARRVLEAANESDMQREVNNALSGMQGSALQAVQQEQDTRGGHRNQRREEERRGSSLPAGRAVLDEDVSLHGLPMSAWIRRAAEEEEDEEEYGWRQKRWVDQTTDEELEEEWDEEEEPLDDYGENNSSVPDGGSWSKVGMRSYPGGERENSADVDKRWDDGYSLQSAHRQQRRDRSRVPQKRVQFNQRPQDDRWSQDMKRIKRHHASQDRRYGHRHRSEPSKKRKVQGDLPGGYHQGSDRQERLRRDQRSWEAEPSDRKRRRDR